MAPKSGFWPWKEALRSDANGSMDINACTDGQSQLTESIAGGVDRGDEHFVQVWNLVLNPVIPGTVGVRAWCWPVAAVVHDGWVCRLVMTHEDLAFHGTSRSWGSKVVKKVSLSRFAKHFRPMVQQSLFKIAEDMLAVGFRKIRSPALD